MSKAIGPLYQLDEELSKLMKHGMDDIPHPWGI
jgi:hypothetical protein